MSRNTHDRRYDHHNVDLDTNVVLNGSTSSYASGATVHSVIDDLDDRISSVSGGSSNPLTTAGDLIVGGVGGVQERLGIGSGDQVLSVKSGAVTWADLPEDAPTLTIKEIDGTPSISDVSTLKLPSGGLVDETGGIVRWAPYRQWVMIIDGGGEVIGDGPAEFYVPMPCSGQFVSTLILADQAGNAELDIWKDALGGFPLSSGDSIVNGHYPALSASRTASDTDLSDWTSTTFAQGDIIWGHLRSSTSVTWLALILRYRET